MATEEGRGKRVGEAGVRGVGGGGEWKGALGDWVVGSPASSGIARAKAGAGHQPPAASRGHQPAAAGAPAAASGGGVIPPAPRPEYAGAAFCRPVLAYEYRRIRDRPTGEPAVYK